LISLTKLKTLFGVAFGLLCISRLSMKSETLHLRISYALLM